MACSGVGLQSIRHTYSDELEEHAALGEACERIMALLIAHGATPV